MRRLAACTAALRSAAPVLSYHGHRPQYRLEQRIHDTHASARALEGPDPMFRFPTSWPSTMDLGHFVRLRQFVRSGEDHSRAAKWLENLLIWQRHDAGEQSSNCMRAARPSAFAACEHLHCGQVTFEAHVGEPFRAPLPANAGQSGQRCVYIALVRGRAGALFELLCERRC